MAQFLKRNWFIVGMFTVLALAFAFPGAGGAMNPRGITNTACVVIMFLLTGFALPSEEIPKGVRDVKLHVFLQLFIFVVIPLYFVCTAFPFRRAMNGYLVIGFYALACLPTTISTCVVFTQMAGGNVVGTVFNSSLSNMAGVFVSPLILTFLVSGSGAAMPLDEALRIFRGLALQILLPFAVGQFFHLCFRQFAGRYKKRLTNMCSLLVLTIIFMAFSNAAQNRELLGRAHELTGMFVYLAVSNVVFVLLAWAGARALGFSRQNVISVVFAAPQKTLAMGIPLLSTYFAREPELLGIAMIPVLFYHPWQLIVAGIVKDSALVRAKEANSNTQITAYKQTTNYKQEINSNSGTAKKP